MPLGSIEAQAPGPRIEVTGSVAFELAWVMESAFRQNFIDDHPDLSALYGTHPDLRARVQAIWEGLETPCGDFLELLVVADHGRVLFSSDADELLDGFEGWCLDVPVDMDFPSEPEEFNPVLRARLRALRDDPAVRDRYLQLLREIWAAVRSPWERFGRDAVAATVAERRRLGDKGGSWNEVGFSGCRVTPHLMSQVEDLGDTGTFVVIPAYFAHENLWFSLPGMVLSSVGTDISGASARARAETLARNLKTLADPTRLAIAGLLAVTPRTVTEVAKAFDLSQPTVSNHVKVLRDAGVVKKVKAEGLWVLRVDRERVEEISGDLLNLLGPRGGD